MTLLPQASARADQGGVSFRVPGIYASMAAVLPDPGFSIPSTFYFYSGKADRSDRFGIGGLIAAGVEVKDFEGVFFENTESQDYKNGIDMHLDWGASQAAE